MNIRQMKYIATAALLALTLTGCGSTANDQAPAVNAAGKHFSNWSSAHKQAYSKAYLQDNAMQCRDCHGLDLSGGIAKVNCFIGILGRNCHDNGHGPRPVPHAMPFTDSASHGPVAKADLAYCQICHGQSGGPGNNPRFNASIGSLPNGCTVSGCHNTNSPAQYRYTSAAHPIPWASHNTAGNLVVACALCHGGTLQGGTGRSCSASECHINYSGNPLPAGTAPVNGQCTSCHNKPPNGSSPTGNRNFGHSAHNAVSSLTGSCNPCHANAGSGTPQHSLRGFTRISTSISSEYKAKAGTGYLVKSVDSNITCRNVSCHGGIETPRWDTGTINISTECYICHSADINNPTPQPPQTPEYNSYYSGKHSYHLASQRGLQCWYCHDLTKLADTHFISLDSPGFNNPRATLHNDVQYVGNSCTPNTSNGNLTMNQCHLGSGTYTWQ